jgi:MFS family permease
VTQDQEATLIEPPALVPPSPGSGLGRALRHRNYRLYFSGQSLSLIGTWITRVAQSWLVYRLTGSSLLLGLVGFASQIPTFLIAPFAGVWVDRLNRHRTLVVTQGLAMLQSALLAAFSLTHTITVAHVLVLGAFQGVINAFDMPARQSFVVELIEDRGDLSNAIALNSSMVNAARLLGPSIAGILIAAVGEGWCFFVDAVSYGAVITSLLAMRIKPRPRRARHEPVMRELGEGFRYVFGSPPIRAVLWLIALVSLMGMPYQVLMPVMANRVLHGGAHTFGFLMGSAGVGALAGTLYLASRKTSAGLGRVVVGSAFVFGVGLCLFSQSRSFALSMPLMLLVGMGMMVQLAASNTVLQILVDEDKRGRVMSFFAMSVFGTAPLGSLLGGAMAARFGAPATLLFGGASCVVGAFAFTRIAPRLKLP